MDVFALVVSIVALGVSLWAIKYTRDQAIAAKTSAASDTKMAELADAQDHAQRTPDFEGSIEPVHNSGWDQLVLRLTNGGPLSEITATIVDGHGVQFTGGQEGVRGRNAQISARWVKPLRLEDTALWRVEVDDEVSDRIRVDVLCRNKRGEQWTVPVWVSLPLRPFVRFV